MVINNNSIFFIWNFLDLNKNINSFQLDFNFCIYIIKYLFSIYSPSVFISPSVGMSGVSPSIGGVGSGGGVGVGSGGGVGVGSGGGVGVGSGSSTTKISNLNREIPQDSSSGS